MPANHHAVVVGINKYPHFQNLSAALNDAKDFLQWVTTTGGVPADQVEKINIQPPLDTATPALLPNRSTVLDALERRLKAAEGFTSTQWKTSRLYFYVAGHGISPAERDAALLGADASVQSLGRHVSCSSLLDFLQRVQRFAEVIIFADCCRTQARNAKQMPVEWTDDDVNNGKVNKFMACGAAFRGLAQEEIHLPEDERRGYFTRALLDGLRGGIKNPQQPGSVTGSELRTHIEEYMRRATASMGLVPQADFIIEGSEVFFPTTSPAAPARHPLTLRFAGGGPPAIAIESDHFPRRLVARSADGRHRIDLEVGLYEILTADGEQPPRGETLVRVVEGGSKYEFTTY